MRLFKHFKQGVAAVASSSSSNHTTTTASSGTVNNVNTSPPPEWTPAPEVSHQFGLFNEASEEEYTTAEQFCARHPVDPPRFLPAKDIDQINDEGCAAWGFDVPTSSRFVGHVQNVATGDQTVVKIATGDKCKAICMLSHLPLMAGLYDIQGRRGIYYEVTIERMNGIIAIGTSCRPYPSWRLPGWNRLSAGLHLDDGRKFFEDPNGGRDYMDLERNPIFPGVTIGCGYEFSSACIFYTYDGFRLPPAFTGVYLPREKHDVFAAIGIEGSCVFEVNFGGTPFKWKDASQWAWRVEGHFGRLGRSLGDGNELPSYSGPI